MTEGKLEAMAIRGRAAGAVVALSNEEKRASKEIRLRRVTVMASFNGAGRDMGRDG